MVQKKICLKSGWDWPKFWRRSLFVRPGGDRRASFSFPVALAKIFRMGQRSPLRAANLATAAPIRDGGPNFITFQPHGRLPGQGNRGTAGEGASLLLPLPYAAE
jgi:hypothetical protein